MPTEALTRGHKKKARTRQLLLDTAREMLVQHGDAFSVGELVARAGVSHGTFYNYFTDRDQLIDALVPHLVAGFAEQSAVDVVDDDPAVRFALITARALARAVDAPAVVGMALRLESVQRALLLDGPLAHLRRDLRAGASRGRFEGRIDDATFDVVVGALLLAARRVVEGETGAAYRRSVLRRLLLLLGVEAGEAAALSTRAVAAASPRRRPGVA